MALREYAKKRRFDQTIEPRPQLNRRNKGNLEFVVQKHKASHLHYDFRLEMEGVLKSWAVPKGPSLRPEDKRLSMMVEDHPFDYRTFEGTIPKGNYGAGEVIVWDRGTYEPLKTTQDPEKELLKELNNGHLSFILHGEKLKGEYALITSKKMEQNAWLLIKKNDDFATDIDITQADQSVISGATIDNLNQHIDVSFAPDATYPKEIKPMLATLVEKPFDDDEWLYEIKWDGYRATGGWDGARVELYSRNGKDFASRYAPIAEALRALKIPMVLDGEIVSLDEAGKAHFEWLQNYHRRNTGVLIYQVFDILWYEGKSLVDLPLIKRKEILKQAVSGNGVIRYSDHIVGRGQEFFAKVSDMELEGMMAKKTDSIYRQDYRSKLWLKIKTHKRQEVVIGGFTEPQGSREHIGALIAGVYERDNLIYVGHTGGGIPTPQLPILRKKLDSIVRPRSPFTSEFKPNGKVHWVEPQFVCEVKFSEWTGDGHMRQPVFVGMREDKNPKDVHKEKPVKLKNRPEVDMDNSRVKFTNLNKIFWPEKGYTKGDLVNYYKKVAPVMLPYVKNSPCNLLRHPNGIAGESFYQKDMPTQSLPGWVKTIEVYSQSNKKDINYYVIDSIDSLLYLVQLGCIEINPWSSRVDSIDNPQWAIIDLDPDEVPFEQVVEVALEVKKVCDQLNLPCFPKTSGQTGMHIFIPVGGKYSYDQIRQFSELIANFVHQSTSAITSLVRNPSKRKNKIYLDYLQNRESQTLAAPYCVRPTKEATVSTPLRWEEVNKKLKPTDFNIRNVPDRIKEQGDLWNKVLGPGIDLAIVLSKI